MILDNYITGNKFKNICDYIFDPNSDIPQKDCSIFCKSDFLKDCIYKISQSKNNYVLISHNSDGNIVDDSPRLFDYKLESIPDNIRVWFAQNVKCYHEKLIPIPIGLENEQWFPEIGKSKILTSYSDKIEKKKLLYINHSISTNVRERLEPYHIFKNSNWCTIEPDCHNGKRYYSYAENLRDHKFVLCPEGYGCDSYRIWESLILNAIPIVKKVECFKIFNSKFNIPFVFVDKWSDITEEFLNSINIDTNFDKSFLNFDFWKNICLMS